jgi:hypothetical protein
MRSLLLLILASVGCANGTSTLVLDVGANGVVELVDHFRVHVTDLGRNLDAVPVDLPAQGRPATLPPSQRLEVRFPATVRGPMYVLVEARDDRDHVLTTGSTQVDIEPSQTVTGPLVLGVVVPPVAVDGGLLDLSRTDLAHADLAGVDLSGLDLSGIDLSQPDLAQSDLLEPDLVPLVPVDYDQSTVSVSPGTSVVADGTSKFTVTMTVLSTSGAPMAGKEVLLSTSAGAPSITQPGPTDANGQTTGTITSTIPATYFVVASVGGSPINHHPSISFVVGPAAKLVFTQPPLDTYANVPFSPRVAIEVEDAAGNAVNSTAAITLALTSRPNSATLLGPHTMNAVSGAATFDPIGIDTAGNGYVITASASGLTSATATVNIKSSTWKSVSTGLDGGQVNQMAGAHGTVWAATSGGVFKSTDSGATWSASSFGIPPVRVDAIAIDAGGTLYAAGQGGNYHSTDGGASWTLGSGGESGWVLAGAGSGTAYSASLNGVFKTVDGGLHWSATSLNTANAFYRSVAVDPANPLIVYASNNSSQLLRSGDGGVSFAPMSGVPQNSAVTSMYHTGTFLYAVTNNQLFQLAEGASTLTVVNGHGVSQPRIVAGSAAAPSKIFLAGTDTSAQFDGASSWSPITGLNTFIQPACLWPLPDDATSVLTGTLWTGVYARRAGGGSFAPSSSGMHALTIGTINSLAMADANTLYLNSQAGLFKTTNAGTSWSLINSYAEGDNWTPVALDPSNPNSVYIGADTGIYTSANGGGSWSPIAISQSASVSALVVKPGAPTVWAGALSGASSQAYISSGGGSFAAAGTGLADTPVWDLALDLSSANPTLFAATQNGIFRTTDATGSSWTQLAFSGQLTQTIALALTPASTDLLTMVNGGIYHSHDYGVTWTAMSIPSDAPFGIGVSVRNFAGAAYATCVNGNSYSILRSTNGGTWSHVEANLRARNLSTRPVISPATDDTVFVGTDNGVFVTTSGGL